MTTVRKSILIILLIVAIFLLIPLITMQFTNEVNWNLLDFVVAGCLLFTTGFIIYLIKSKVKKRYQIVLFVLVIFMLLLVWAELGVGLFGSSFAGD